jgi:hypothetical protein
MKLHTPALTTAATALTLALVCWGSAHAAVKRPPSAKAVPKAVALPEAGPEQLQAAGVALTGSYECEFKQSIDVGANPKSPGYLDVRYKNSSYAMKPVLSSTGALRLEDVKGVTLLLQIANKSMLMDTKAGKRVVDNCVHAKQREAMQAAAANPAAPSDLLK